MESLHLLMHYMVNLWQCSSVVYLRDNNMADCIVECVPNFSEGRDQNIINAIAAAGRGIDGARVLGVEPDKDYNRTVLTIAGEPRAVSTAAFEVIKAAYEHIDMQNHEGEHPRIGAVDVCPFVPLKV